MYSRIRGDALPREVRHSSHMHFSNVLTNLPFIVDFFFCQRQRKKEEKKENFQNLRGTRDKIKHTCICIAYIKHKKTKTKKYQFLDLQRVGMFDVLAHALACTLLNKLVDLALLPLVIYDLTQQ